MSKIIILAIDGGGIKGVIPAYILTQIERALGKACYQMFDIVGGTSTGGIITLALTSPIKSGLPLPAQDILSIYQNNGGNIFVPQESAIPDFYAVYYSDNGSGRGVEPFLQGILGNTTLSGAKAAMRSNQNARTKQVFTTSYAINSSGGKINDPQLGKDYGPYLFNWNDAAKSPQDDYYLWEAARATSAAPTYFPVAHVGGDSGKRSSANERWLLDGGVMSNDPAVWGISETFRLTSGSSITMKDIALVTLGTGTYPAGAGLMIDNEGITVPADGNWGMTPWTASDLYDLSETTNGRGAIINIITESVQLVTDLQILPFINAGLTHFRLEPQITQAQSKMDNISSDNINSLLMTAQSYLTNEGKSTFDQLLRFLNEN